MKGPKIRPIQIFLSSVIGHAVGSEGAGELPVPAPHPDLPQLCWQPPGQQEQPHQEAGPGGGGLQAGGGEWAARLRTGGPPAPAGQSSSHRGPASQSDGEQCF